MLKLFFYLLHQIAFFCRKDPCISSKRWFMSIPEGFDYGVSLESIVYGE